MKAQEHIDGHGSPKAAEDHYRLLQLDPDAPQQLIAEAYWFLASRLRAEKLVRRSAERELVTLNAAYQVLAVAEQRRAYDATVARVLDLRREREERANAGRQSFPGRLFRKARRPQVDYYELLQIDPQAESLLIARAYTILRTLHSAEPAGDAPRANLAELAEARATLLDRTRRAAYDESRGRATTATSAPRPSPTVEPKAKAPTKKATPVSPTVELKAEAKARVAKARPEKRSGPSPSARAMRGLSKAFVATAKGGGQLASDAGRLGYHGFARAAVEGGRGGAAAIKAGRRTAERLRNRQQAKQAPGALPDERLLRDVAPAPSRTRSDDANGRPRGRLILCGPAGEEETFELGEEPVTLGSDRECDLRLEAESGAVAPAHAQLWFTGERFVIRSLDPIHPTVLCGQRVNWAGLDDGDEIEIGPHRLRFEAVHAWDAPPSFLSVEHDAAASAEEIPERHE